VTEWAQRILPLKSAMISEDASSIEEAFRSKMAAIEVELMSDEHSVGQPELEATRLTRSLAARNEKSVRVSGAADPQPTASLFICQSRRNLSLTAEQLPRRPSTRASLR
jgi:hypothetical protein